MPHSQQYEDYWKLTLEYSDIYESNFNNCLKIIVAFIDREMYLLKVNPTEAYNKLTAELEQTFPKKDSGSTRKSINQFIKLGFVNTGLISYHPLTKAFMNETDRAKKRTLFSQIVYGNSSFSRSFTNHSDVREINFVVKTLIAVGRLSKEDILALMTVDIPTVGDDHLNGLGLTEARLKAKGIGFGERKYNQVNYLWNILKKLDDLAVQNDYLYLESDPRVIVEAEEAAARKGRDPYLQKLYKNQLVEESVSVFGKVVCMAEQLDYPALIASHIKPYIQSSEEEAFDVNNGLLLSLNLDALFDQGYISFEDNGQMIVSHSKNFTAELERSLHYRLDQRLLTKKRLEYLKFHRDNVFHT